MTRPRIEDIRAAIAERGFPSVTIWNRVEGRPRTTDFAKALAAEVRDPLWLLARQWQLGEFLGEDAGSPATATYHANITKPVRFAPREERAEDIPADLPLEAMAERRAVRFVLGPDKSAFDLRLAMGRRWLKMVPPGLRGRYVARWPVTMPDPEAEADAAVVAHPAVWATIQAAAGRLMDGFELFAHLRRDGAADDGIDGLSPAERDAVRAAGTRFVAWFQELISQPRGGRGSWDPSRLEHRFRIAAPGPDAEQVLVTQEYWGGRLDWDAMSVDADPAEPMGANDPAARTTVTRTVLPVPVRYSGMPHARWWAFEDGRTNFSAVNADATDLVRLMFLEFALVFSDDWHLLPCDVEAGSLATVDGVVVTDVFGQRFWIPPMRNADWQRWGMYRLTGGEAGLFVPAAPPKTAEGPPVEEVLFIRDENANLVWGIERVIPLVTGDGGAGTQAAAETVDLLGRLRPPAPPPTPAAPIGYRAMSTIPENWIPFIPVRVPGSNREIQLRRAALPRMIDDGPGRPEPVRPRTTLLREETPYLVHEEEVPRAGTRVRLAYNRTRTHDGRVVVWLSAQRETGRGEGSSGLAFDNLVYLHEDSGRAAAR